ncbi:uncharacterized protein HMPREF1541_09843 [Cyphellophora europaea CBS 101466]|uniref:Uncharacterized protein n=1 Tax=Cyphellophora europaea (strain CBS 101466) TaxID=1220924 RepID=W2SAC6_CYPE1|nr:uncharacterized protein HMPREF1541_09843 [Cyphellophora europaea CBS 101466]ETN44968.1 hypothetical protein HMPREF1541_09843 [Cyphellophora europaea CBS 101466]
MSHGIEIIDPGAGYDVDPLPRDDGGGRFDYDDITEIKPAPVQRMSSLSIHEVKPNTKARRDSALDRDNFAYWRFEKEGDDWSQAVRRALIAPQNEIERMAKKGKGSVLAETKRMSSLRSAHLQRLVDKLNDEEPGNARWEPVYIESNKVNRRTGRIECKSMDVIFKRRLPSPRPSVRYRSTSGGELVDVFAESKPKGDKKDKDKTKDKKDKDRSASPSRDSLVDDPFGNQKFFHSSGKPLDDKSGLPMVDGGLLDLQDPALPTEIPPERPIGYREERGRGDKKDKKDKKRGKSREADDIYGEIVEVGDFEDPAGVVADSLDSMLHRDPEDMPVIEPGGSRSRSRRRSKSKRRRSRDQPESIILPPNYQTRRYMGDHGDSSSESSSESRYGIIDREELSSRTSSATYPSIGRRSSHFDDDRPRKVYREHHPGPSRGGQKYYHGETRVYEEPSRSKQRYSRSYYPPAERIPEARQIGFRDYAGEVVPRSYVEPDSYYPPRARAGPPAMSPILHYPGEMPEKRAESYMQQSIRDEFLDRRERNIRDREARLDEEDYRRRELERMERERELEDMERREAEARYEDEVRREYERRRRMDDDRRYHEDRYRPGDVGYDRY